MRITRRRFFASAAAGAGGIFAYVAGVNPPDALAARYCPRQDIFAICLGGTTSGCRVQYGPPNCTQSRVVVYSPSEAFYIDCVVYCPSGTCQCAPQYFQARGACGNGGSCSCTVV